MQNGYLYVCMCCLCICVHVYTYIMYRLKAGIKCHPQFSPSDQAGLKFNRDFPDAAS